MGWVGGLGVIIKSNLNRVRLSCCGVGVGLGCDNKLFVSICTELGFNFLSPEEDKTMSFTIIYLTFIINAPISDILEFSFLKHWR